MGVTIICLIAALFSVDSLRAARTTESLRKTGRNEHTHALDLAVT